MASPTQPLPPRHVPHRTCVGCRSQHAKRELVRVVRTPAGEVMVDPTGRLAGRGAYLHRDPECWSEGMRKGRLARALHTTISADDQASILLSLEGEDRGEGRAIVHPHALPEVEGTIKKEANHGAQTTI